MAGVTGLRSSRYDIPTSTVGLVGTQQSSSIYGSVAFDLTLFNEVTKSDNLLRNIKANVIDSCNELIIGLPDTGKVGNNKTVDFVGFDNDKNRQNDDNVVKAYKGLFS